MISVTIAINGSTIVHRSAVNITSEFAPGSSYNEIVNTYRSDDGKIIKHARKDGAIKLAIKMLRLVVAR